MCIRDSQVGPLVADHHGIRDVGRELDLVLQLGRRDVLAACLLYTSDAADERSSVDLGGRRIIKKKNINNTCRCEYP